MSQSTEIVTPNTVLDKLTKAAATADLSLYAEALRDSASLHAKGDPAQARRDTEGAEALERVVGETLEAFLERTGSLSVK